MDQVVLNDYQRLRRLAFPAGARTAEKKWRQANPEIRKAKNKRWKATNADQFRVQKNCSVVIKFAKKWGARIGNRKTIRKIYDRAAELRQWFDVEVDHIIPMAKGGAHTPENLQIIYAFENHRKRNSLTYKPKVIFI